MRSLLRWFQLGIVGLVGVVWPIIASAFSGDIKNDPSQMVEKYLSLDKRGARLEVNSLDVLAPFVGWKEEPTWGRVVVISEFRVIEDVTQWEVLTSTEVLIPVTFTVVGTMYWESATFLPESQIYLEYFHVKAIDERWRIVAPPASSSRREETISGLYSFGSITRNRQESNRESSISPSTSQASTMTASRAFQDTQVDLVLFDLDGTLIDFKGGYREFREFHAEGFGATSAVS